MVKTLAHASAPLKGVWHKIFRLQVFLWISFFPRPLNLIIPIGWGHFKFLWKSTEIFCNLVSTTRTSCSSVSTTLAINYWVFPWHWWLSLVPDFHRFQDTGDKIYRRYQRHRQYLLAISNDTGYNLLSVTTKYTDDERCKDISLHTHQKEYKVKNHYVNVNSNPTASHRNKKFPFLHLSPVSLTPVINLYFWIL